MERSVWLERLLVAAAALLTVWGIGSFGLWDPWELDAASAAFGSSEWSARLPAALAGLLTCLLAFDLLRRGLSARAGVLAVAVMASSPLYLFNSRLLLGDAPGFAAQAWVGLAAFATMDARTARSSIASIALLALGVAASSQLSGVLLGPLPPILAVAALGLIAEKSGEENPVAGWLLPLAAALLALGVVRAVALDSPELSVWLGGGALGGNPPRHDKALELVFHGFAPWSAALPVAAVWVVAPRAGRSRRTQNLAWVLALWASFAFVSWTVFASRYGTPPFLASVPLAGLIAIWLEELGSDSRSHWPAAVVVALLVALLVRDYALYPESPLRVLPIDDLRVPSVYRPARHWALALSLSGLAICLALVSHPRLARPEARNGTRWLREKWNEEPVARGWSLLAALLLAACSTFGLMCLLLDLPIPSVAVRVGKVLFFVPFILLGLLLGLPWLRYGFGRLGSARTLVALAACLSVGAFAGLSFQPELSRHFSPRPVYEAFSELSEGRAEPLASYRLPTTAARYYTRAAAEEISDSETLLRFLGGGGQRWAVIQADQLARLNEAYREQTGTHLYVADARSARLLLLAAAPIEGRPNQSFIAEAVLDEVPEPQQRVGAQYEDSVELLGYDLELPGGDSVGAGQRFKITWYWRVIGEMPAGYKIFLHVDGEGLRLNGDHDPVGARYPTKLWKTGDVIVDTQELTVPPNFLSSDYVMYVGFFSGSTRLKVKSGPNDGADRVRAGVLPVR